MHEMFMHVNRIDLRIKALIALEEDDPEDPFFSLSRNRNKLQNPGVPPEWLSGERVIMTCCL